MSKIADIIKTVFPRTESHKINQYETDLNTLVSYGINTDRKLAGFLSQVGHESMGFSVVEENLNYSADGLLRVFPKYFTKIYVGEYHRQPIKIANRVYANRMGNDSEESGDGYRYRGRGLIQLTGKDNYQKFSDFCGIDVVNNPDYLLSPHGAFLSAVWYWERTGCSVPADKGDVLALTKLINGGSNGLADRERLYNEFLHQLKNSSVYLEYANTKSNNKGAELLLELNNDLGKSEESIPIIIDVSDKNKKPNDPMQDFSMGSG
jgi:putative chitinase